MEINFLIHFLENEVSFRFRMFNNNWVEIGSISAESSWNNPELKWIKRRAAKLGGGHLVTVLIAQKEYVRYSSFTSNTNDHNQIITEINQHLILETGLEPTEFAIDWIQGNQQIGVARIEINDLNRLETFVSNHGFEVASVATIQDDHEEFPQELVFKISESKQTQGLNSETVREVLNSVYDRIWEV